MKYLLDTHVFIWWTENSPRLKTKFKSAISLPENKIYLSIISLWEITIKVSLRKLRLKIPVDKLPLLYDFEILPLKVEHLPLLLRLPPIHKDPFDRMLIAQAQHENLVLLTSDPKITAYHAPQLSQQA